MNRSKRLERVTDIRREQERQAGSRLAEAQQEHQSKEHMLQQLLDYRSEYQTMFDELSTSGLDVQQYQNFQRFFSQLDRAVSEQRNALQIGESQVAQSRGDWLERHQASETLARLTSLAQSEEHLAENKLEQKQADEHHARRPRN